MRDQWLPLILDRGDIPSVDDRASSWFAGVEAFLLNNAQPAKVAVYLGLVLLLLGRGVPWAGSVYAGRMIAHEKGYVTTEANGIKVWFDADASPASSLRWLRSVGPIHHLDLANTKVGDLGLQALPRSDTLTILKLEDTQVTARALPSLARFPNLRELSLYNTPLGSLEALPTWAALQVLDLANTGIQDRDLARLSPLITLEELDLSNNPITGSGLSHLVALSRLRTLSMKNTALSDVTLTELPPLPLLEVLSLYGIPIKGSTLGHLRSFESLRSLNLAYTELDDAGLSQLPPLRNLTEIFLTSAVNISGLSFSVLGGIPALEKLWLKDTRVGTSTLKHLSMLQNLRILALPGTKIGPGSLAYLRRLARLKELYLGTTDITDDDLHDVLEMPLLEKLYLPANPQITDRGLLLLRELHSLRELNIERTGTSQKAREEFQRARPDVKLIW
jgi:Leucine-rich repeat (LRR) protein